MMHAVTPDRRALPALPTPQSLVVASNDSAGRAAVLALLECAGLRTASSGDSIVGQPRLELEDHPVPMPGWSDWLVERPQAHLVLLIPLPALAVARSLGEGVAPKAALTRWLESAHAVLELIRRQRRRVSLVFAEPALVTPQAFLDALSQRLQLPLEPARTDSPPPGLPNALLHMMAENVIRQSIEARNTAAELEANALPLADSEVRSIPEIDQVFIEYRNSIESTAQHTQELCEENDLLQVQLHQVQEDLESYFLKLRRTEEQLSEAKKQVQQVEKRAEEVKVKESKDAPRLQGLQEENDLLLQQLHHVQQELEGYYLQGNQRSGELHDLQQRLRAAEETVQALYNSKSWKITKPLRMMLDLFTGGNKAG